MEMPKLVLPTFLGIGAMRSGSTWLYEVLRSHPEIQMSRHKELDFFFLNKMLDRDLRWYANQFIGDDAEPPRSIRGEISPRYSRLKKWHVRRLAGLIPQLRVVFTIRNPLERIWSQAVYDFGHLSGRDTDRLGIMAFLQQFERPRTRLSSDYSRTIAIWRDAFGDEAVLINVFDDLSLQPAKFVDDVLRHIGASTNWSAPSELIGKKVFSRAGLLGETRPIPEVLRWYIASEWLGPMKILNEQLGGRIAHWVDEMDEIAADRRLSWRALREINRAVLALPERMAFRANDIQRDVRLWLRWRHLLADSI